MEIYSTGNRHFVQLPNGCVLREGVVPLDFEWLNIPVPEPYQFGKMESSLFWRDYWHTLQGYRP